MRTNDFRVPFFYITIFIYIFACYNKKTSIIKVFKSDRKGKKKNPAIRVVSMASQRLQGVRKRKYPIDDR